MLLIIYCVFFSPLGRWWNITINFTSWYFTWNICGRTRQKSRARLLYTEKSIYTIICTIKLRLLSAEVDTTDNVISNVLSPEFVSVDGNYTKEFYRIYVVMKDSERLLSYLNVIYTTLSASLAPEDNGI